MDSEVWILNSEFWILRLPPRLSPTMKSEVWILNSEIWILRCNGRNGRNRRIHGPSWLQPWSLNSEFWILNSEFWILNSELPDSICLVRMTTAQMYDKFLKTNSLSDFYTHLWMKTMRRWDLQLTDKMRFITETKTWRTPVFLVEDFLMEGLKIWYQYVSFMHCQKKHL